MPILTLLERVRATLAQVPHPVRARPDAPCHHYLTGLAMQAYADGTLTETERCHFMEMAQLFDVDQHEAAQILADAQTPSEETVNRIRASLSGSKYKYYFILDLQIMAHQDQVVKVVESEVIKRFGEILEVAAEDRQFLVSLADAVANHDQQAKEAWTRNFLDLKSKPAASPEDFLHYTE